MRRTVDRVAPRILIVEDEPELAALLARGLQAEGYVVTIAHNGIDAITVARESRFDAAVLDIMLPGMSGFELCRRLREETTGVAILLLTARDALDDRVIGAVKLPVRRPEIEVGRVSGPLRADRERGDGDQRGEIGEDTRRLLIHQIGARVVDRVDYYWC